MAVIKTDDKVSERLLSIDWGQPSARQRAIANAAPVRNLRGLEVCVRIDEVFQHINAYRALVEAEVAGEGLLARSLISQANAIFNEAFVNLEKRHGFSKVYVDACYTKINPFPFIAEESNIPYNPMELEGALTRVTAYASLNNEPINLDQAQYILKDLISDDDAQEITSELILDETANYFGFSIAELQSKSRTRTLVTARQIAMYLLRELTEMSLPRIGAEFGGRDHTTVMHADRKIRDLMSERHAIYNQVTELTNKIKQRARNI